MMNNDSALQLSNVLNQECTRSQVHCQSKKRALEIISELAAKQLSLPPQVVFEAILTREKMGSTGIGNGIAIPHGKLEEDTLRAEYRRRRRSLVDGYSRAGEEAHRRGKPREAVERQ